MSPQAGYLLQDQIVPRFKSAVPTAVNCVGSEDPAELVQDATAFAAKMMDNAERAGKKVVRTAASRGARSVSAGNICFYTIQHLKSGRRSTGSSISDVYGSQTQLNGRTRLTSLDDEAAVDEENGGEIFEFHDVLAAPQEDPSMTAARQLDWQMFWSRLSIREKAMVQFVAEGKPLRKAARALRMSSSAVKNIKQDLALKLLDFMGADILVQVQRLPPWKKGLAGHPGEDGVQGGKAALRP